MSFREPTVLLGLRCCRSRCSPTSRCSAAPARGGGVRQPGAPARADDRAARLAPPPPAALLLLAVAALILALARPQRSVAAPQRAATVVLVNDVSGSMRADDVEPDRLTAAVESAKVLVEKTPDNFRLGLVTFADYAEQIVAPTTDRGAVEGALERMVADGGTGDGRRARARAAVGRRRRCRPGRQGHAQAAGDHRAALRRQEHARRQRPARHRPAGQQARIPIYAIALGTESGEVVQQDPFGFMQRIPVPPDKETLREIARVTGGRFFEAVSADDAEEIYGRIGTRLTSKPSSAR